MCRRQPLHPLAKVTIVLRPQHEMEMIGQKAIREQPHRDSLACLFHQFLKRRIVTIFMKDSLAPVATVQDMVTNVAQRYSGFSSHSVSLKNVLAIVNKVA